MIRPDQMISLSDLLTTPVRPGSPPARPVSWRAGWWALLIASFARAVLAILLGLVFWSVAPIVTGWHPSVVMTGSMEPALHPGDIVITRSVPASKLSPGQILLVDDPDRAGQLRLHRLVGIDPNGRLILRGDANSTADSDPISIDHVRGVGVLRVPRVGLPMHWLRTHDYRDLGLVGAGFVLAFGLASCYKGTVLEQAPVESRARSKVLVRGAALIVLLGLTGGQLVHPNLAHAVTIYKGSTANPSDLWTTPANFSCLQSQSSTPQTLYLHLDESSGTTATDSSGNSDTGTYTSGGITYGVAGICRYDHGTAVTLDGSTGFITTATQFNNPQTFSLEIWFNTTTSLGGKLIGFGTAQTGASGQYDRHMYLTNAGKVAFGVYSGGNKTILSPNSYNDGKWHLADATFSAGTGMILYVDGQQVAADATVTTAENDKGYWRVGYDSISSAWASAPTSKYLAGSVDEVAVYPAVLSSAQVAAHYGSGC